MRRPSAVLVLWFALLVAAIAVVANTRYTTDLSAFLPRSPTVAQQLLVDQLRDGLTSRLVLIGIEGADQTERARASRDLAERLRTGQFFTWVNNGDGAGQERDRDFVLTHRYALSNAVSADRFTVDGLRDAIQSTIGLLISPAGSLIKPYLTRDPTGELVEVLDQLTQGGGPETRDGVWVSRDGQRAVMVAETRAAGSDIDGQQRAIESIRSTYAAAGSTARLLISGAGAFAVTSRNTIESEAVRLSVVSAALIAALLWLVYRSVAALLLGMLPIVCGAIAGIAAVALGFGAVHGVTLGFGITLIGESVDYSIYQFIQSRQQRALWRTIALGVVTSVCGFASLLPSSFPGLAQLGLYSISGLVVAAVVTRFVLPQLLPRQLVIRDLTGLGQAAARVLRRARYARWLLAVLPLACAGVLYVHRDSLWNHELSSLSPTPVSDQLLDGELRADLGAADVRYLVVVSGADMDSALRTSEQVAVKLDTLVAAGELGGYDAPSRYLPSSGVQRARLASLPAGSELRTRLRLATAGLPLAAERLDTFVTEVEAARNARPATRADLEGTSLAAAVDGMLFRSGSRWQALLSLRAPTEGSHPAIIDPERVRSALGTDKSVLLVDIKQETDTLYASYFSEAAWLSLAGVAVIILMLLAVQRSLQRVARVVTPLLLSVLTVAAGLAMAGIALTIMHLVGMLLIVAVGSNYALFFDDQASEAELGTAPLTLASLLIANAATVVGFGVLATSSVPVLQALGMTVSPGALLALLFAALLSPAGNH